MAGETPASRATSSTLTLMLTILGRSAITAVPCSAAGARATVPASAAPGRRCDVEPTLRTGVPLARREEVNWMQLSASEGE
ncbi:hypothetical protein GCM10027079_15020 [Sediminivirga luteola]|uniref:Uncharacterized protein n=1 Tax=Sediminivirga luteola TaxID=1774748 RepID=A0A8J2TVD9_9MICO|nr:hypothetical protein GCM10011333_02480 [Sediminivirga luteola]